MASNVFGNPITDSTLKGMTEYRGQEVKRTDRAYVALNMKNAAEKDSKARQYVEKESHTWPAEVPYASTRCLIYNATGDTVKLATSHDWHGQVGYAPYPIIIANGQWGAFLHVKTSGTDTGSSAAVVYRGKNEAGNYCDWMLSWSNPCERAGDNKVYSEIREFRYYEDNDNWGYIANEKLCKSGVQNSDEWNGCMSTVATGGGSFPIFEAILTLKDAA